jgi:hypothetical protein
MAALHAQTPAGTDAVARITALQIPIRAATEESEKATAALQTSYLGALKQLLSERSSAGDLDTVIAVKAEQDRITANVQPIAEEVQGMPPALRKLRTTYDTAAKRNADDTARRMDLANRGYLANLEALQKSLTSGGNLEQALVVRAEKERFIAQAGGTAAKTASPQANTPSAPNTPGAPVLADPATATVNALVAGSRWQWFDSPNFTGKAHWVEFYKDGTARTSWQTGHTWDTLPPNILHLRQPSDKREWYFDIDIAKRTAVRNDEKDSKNNNSMRYEKRVTKPPGNAKPK